MNSRTRLKTLFLGALIGATMSVGVFLFIPPPQDAIAYGSDCATALEVQAAVGACAKSWEISDCATKSEVQDIVMTSVMSSVMTWCNQGDCDTNF